MLHYSANNVLFASVRPAVVFTAVPVVRFDRSFAVAFYATSASYQKRPLNRAALPLPSRTTLRSCSGCLIARPLGPSTVFDRFPRQITFQRCVALVRSGFLYEQSNRYRIVRPESRYSKFSRAMEIKHLSKLHERHSHGNIRKHWARFPPPEL